MTGDTPFARRLFIELSLDEQNAFIEGIRTRRLASVEAFTNAQALKQRAKDERLVAKLGKECDMMEKEIDALDRALAKVEKRATNLTAIRLIIESHALSNPSTTNDSEDESDG